MHTVQPHGTKLCITDRTQLIFAMLPILCGVWHCSRSRVSMRLLGEKLTRANSTLPTAGLPIVTTLMSAAGHCSAAHTPHSVACTP